MENQGQIQDFLNVLSQRRWQILLPALFMLVLGVALAVIVPKKYLVVTRIELRESPLGEESAPERELWSAEQHIKHYGRVRGVIEQQASFWPEYFELAPGNRQDFIKGVIDDIDVIPLEKIKDRGSTFVDIAYTDVDPSRAEQFLSQLTGVWIKEVVERELNAGAAELQVLRNELNKATRDWEELSAQFYTLASGLEIDTTQPIAAKFENRGDPISRRRENAQEVRDLEEVALSGLKGELEALQQQLTQMPPTIAIDAAQDDTFEKELLQIQRDIDAAELEQARYKPANSRYQSIQGKLDNLRRERANLEKLRDESVAVQSEVPNPVYEQLEFQIGSKQREIAGKLAAITELDSELAELSLEHTARSREYSTLSKLQSQRELAWEEIGIKRAARDLQQTKLLVMQDAYGRPFDIAQEPEASDKPTEPNPIVIVVGALLLGLALGLGLAVAAEFASNGFRSVHDLRQVMNVPVLGAVNAIVTRSEARRARARRTVVGLSSAIVMGSVLWITWTWSASPERLPLGVVEAIDGFRKMLL